MIKKALVISFISLLFSSEAFAILGRSTSFDNRAVCEESKGVWRQFGNGCADNCESKFDEFSICTQSLVFACDCGKNRCWNGETCVTMTSYKEIYDVKKAEEKKILDEAKEKRKAAAKSNMEAIMTKLTQPAGDPNLQAQNPQNQNNSNQIDYSKPRESVVTINDPSAVKSSDKKSDKTKTSKQDSNKSKDDITTPVQILETEIQAEIPPLYLQKQAKKQQEKIDSSKSEIAPGLPEIELPN